jgi:hypothetical protein
MSAAKAAAIPKAAHMFQAKLEFSGTDHSPLNMRRKGPGAKKYKNSGDTSKEAGMAIAAENRGKKKSNNSESPNRSRPASLRFSKGPVIRPATNSDPPTADIVIPTHNTQQPSQTACIAVRYLYDAFSFANSAILLLNGCFEGCLRFQIPT